VKTWFFKKLGFQIKIVPLQLELTAARRGVRLGACASQCAVLDNACESFEASQAYPVRLCTSYEFSLPIALERRLVW
jgi:hypothetical protein